MQLKKIMVCDHCSLGCSHCPYAHDTGNDYAPPERINYACNEKIILTGGELFESAYIYDWIEQLDQESIFFRIATGGHVPLEHWYKFLKMKQYFLGVNISTDIFTSRVKKCHDLYRIWRINWDLFSQLPNTWLTVTLNEDVYETLIQLIDDLRPTNLLINFQQNTHLLPEKTLHIIRNKFPDIYLQAGFIA